MRPRPARLGPRRHGQLTDVPDASQALGTSFEDRKKRVPTTSLEERTGTALIDGKRAQQKAQVRARLEVKEGDNVNRAGQRHWVTFPESLHDRR